MNLSLNAASAQVGKTQSFTATLQNDTQSKGVNWTLSGTACTGAACGTLSASSGAKESGNTHRGATGTKS